MKRPVITILGLCGRSVFLKVDHFHHPGETLHASAIHIEPGGKGYNQAVAAARLGAEVHFIASCGEDEDGKACSEFLLEEGIAPHIQIVKDATAFASILTDADGDNQVTVFRGAADKLSADFVSALEPVFEKSDIVLLNFEVPSAANEAAIVLAEKHAAKLILNPAPAHPCSKEFIDHFFCITPNESESEIIGIETDREVITLGSKGALVKDRGIKTYLPAVKVTAKDTTGAGDCFTAALAVAIGEGKDLLEAAQFAQKAAAKSVEQEYVMPSLPYRNTLE